MKIEKPDLLAIIVMVCVIIALTWMMGHYVQKSRDLEVMVEELQKERVLSLGSMDVRLGNLELQLALFPTRTVVLIDVEDYMKEGAE